MVLLDLDMERESPDQNVWRLELYGYDPPGKDTFIT